jgi:hypothetical protein
VTAGSEPGVHCSTDVLCPSNQCLPSYCICLPNKCVAVLAAQDVKLFDLTLERDQAFAQVSRLQQRLDDLLEQLSGNGSLEGVQAGAGAAAAPAAAAGSKGPGMASVGSRTGSKKQPTAREQVVTWNPLCTRLTAL